MVTLQMRLTRNNKEQGFGLVELVIAIAIAGIIGAAAATVIIHMFQMNASENTRMIAVKQVERTIHQLSRDVQMAQGVDVTAPSGLPLSLSWIGWDSNKYEVTYRLGESTGTVKALERQVLTYDASGNLIDSQTTILAKFIDPDPTMTNFQDIGGMLSYKITAFVDGFRSSMETREGGILPRVV